MTAAEEARSAALRPAAPHRSSRGTARPGAPQRPEPPALRERREAGPQRPRKTEAREEPAAGPGRAARTGRRLAQVLLQQIFLQQELEPGGLRRSTGPAGGGGLPVRRFGAHRCSGPVGTHGHSRNSARPRRRRSHLQDGRRAPPRAARCARGGAALRPRPLPGGGKMAVVRAGTCWPRSGLGAAQEKS